MLRTGFCRLPFVFSHMLAFVVRYPPAPATCSLDVAEATRDAWRQPATAWTQSGLATK